MKTIFKFLGVILFAGVALVPQTLVSDAWAQSIEDIEVRGFASDGTATNPDNFSVVDTTDTSPDSSANPLNTATTAIEWHVKWNVLTDVLVLRGGTRRPAVAPEITTQRDRTSYQPNFIRAPDTTVENIRLDDGSMVSGRAILSGVTPKRLPRQFTYDVSNAFDSNSGRYWYNGMYLVICDTGCGSITNSNVNNLIVTARMVDDDANQKSTHVIRVEGINNSHRPTSGTMRFRLDLLRGGAAGAIASGVNMIRNRNNHGQRRGSVGDNAARPLDTNGERINRITNFFLTNRNVHANQFTRTISNFQRAYHASSDTEEGTTSTGMGRGAEGLGSSQTNAIVGERHRYFGWNFTANNNAANDAPAAERGGLNNDGANSAITATATADSGGGFSVQMDRFIINCRQCTSAFSLSAPSGQVAQDSLSHRLRIDGMSVAANSFPVAFTLSQPAASTVFNFDGKEPHIRTIYFRPSPSPTITGIRHIAISNTGAELTSTTAGVGMGSVESPYGNRAHAYRFIIEFDGTPVAPETNFEPEFINEVRRLTSDNFQVDVRCGTTCHNFRGIGAMARRRGDTIEVDVIRWREAGSSGVQLIGGIGGVQIVDNGNTTYGINDVASSQRTFFFSRTAPGAENAVGPAINAPNDVPEEFREALPTLGITGISHAAISPTGFQLNSSTRGVGMGSVGNPYGNRAHGYRFTIQFDGAPVGLDTTFTPTDPNNVRRFTSDNFEVDIRCGTTCSGFTGLNAVARRVGNNIQVDITGWRAAGALGDLLVGGTGGIRIIDKGSASYGINEMDSSQRTFFFARTTGTSDQHDDIGAINIPDDIPTQFRDVLPTFTRTVSSFARAYHATSATDIGTTSSNDTGLGSSQSNPIMGQTHRYFGWNFSVNNNAANDAPAAERGGLNDDGTDSAITVMATADNTRGGYSVQMDRFIIHCRECASAFSFSAPSGEVMPDSLNHRLRIDGETVVSRSSPVRFTLTQPSDSLVFNFDGQAGNVRNLYFMPPPLTITSISHVAITGASPAVELTSTDDGVGMGSVESPYGNMAHGYRYIIEFNRQPLNPDTTFTASNPNANIRRLTSNNFEVDVRCGTTCSGFTGLNAVARRVGNSIQVDITGWRGAGGALQVGGIGGVRIVDKGNEMYGINDVASSQRTFFFSRTTSGDENTVGPAINVPNDVPSAFRDALPPYSHEINVFARAHFSAGGNDTPTPLSDTNGLGTQANPFLGADNSLIGWHTQVTPSANGGLANGGGTGDNDEIPTTMATRAAGGGYEIAMDRFIVTCASCRQAFSMRSFLAVNPADTTTNNIIIDATTIMASSYPVAISLSHPANTRIFNFNSQPEHLRTIYYTAPPPPRPAQISITDVELHGFAGSGSGRLRTNAGNVSVVNSASVTPRLEANALNTATTEIEWHVRYNIRTEVNLLRGSGCRPNPCDSGDGHFGTETTTQGHQTGLRSNFLRSSKADQLNGRGRNEFTYAQNYVVSRAHGWYNGFYLVTCASGCDALTTTNARQLTVTAHMAEDNRRHIVRIAGLTNSHRPTSGNMRFQLHFSNRDANGIIRSFPQPMLRNADHPTQTADNLVTNVNRCAIPKLDGSTSCPSAVSFHLSNRNVHQFTRTISNFARAYHATSKTDEGTTSTEMGTGEAGLGSSQTNAIIGKTHRYFGWNFTANNNTANNAPASQLGGLNNDGTNSEITATATADSARGGYSVAMDRFVINCADCTSAFSISSPSGEVMTDSLNHRLRIDGNTVQANSFPVTFTLTQPSASRVFNFDVEPAHVRTIYFTDSPPPMVTGISHGAINGANIGNPLHSTTRGVGQGTFGIPYGNRAHGYRFTIMFDGEPTGIDTTFTGQNFFVSGTSGPIRVRRLTSDNFQMDIRCGTTCTGLDNINAVARRSGNNIQVDITGWRAAGTLGDLLVGGTGGIRIIDRGSASYGIDDVDNSQRTFFFARTTGTVDQQNDIAAINVPDDIPTQFRDVLPTFTRTVSSFARAYHATSSTDIGTTSSNDTGLGSSQSNPIMGETHRYFGWNFSVNNNEDENAPASERGGLNDDGTDSAISVMATADNTRGGYSVQMDRFIIHCRECTSEFSFSAPAGQVLQDSLNHRLRIDGETVVARSSPVRFTLTQPSESRVFNFDGQEGNVRNLYFTPTPLTITGISHVAITGANPGVALTSTDAGVGMGSVESPYGNMAHGYRFIIQFDRKPSEPTTLFSGASPSGIRRLNSINFEIDIRCGTTCSGFANLNATARRNGNNIEIDITGWRAAGASGGQLINGIGGVRIKDSGRVDDLPYDIEATLDISQRTFFFSRTTTGDDDSFGPAINVPNDIPTQFRDLFPTFTHSIVSGQFQRSYATSGITNDATLMLSKTSDGVGTMDNPISFENTHIGWRIQTTPGNAGFRNDGGLGFGPGKTTTFTASEISGGTGYEVVRNRFVVSCASCTSAFTLRLPESLPNVAGGYLESYFQVLTSTLESPDDVIALEISHPTSSNLFVDINSQEAHLRTIYYKSTFSDPAPPLAEQIRVNDVELHGFDGPGGGRNPTNSGKVSVVSSQEVPNVEARALNTATKEIEFHVLYDVRTQVNLLRGSSCRPNPCGTAEGHGAGERAAQDDQTGLRNDFNRAPNNFNNISLSRGGAAAGRDILNGRRTNEFTYASNYLQGSPHGWYNGFYMVFCNSGCDGLTSSNVDDLTITALMRDDRRRHVIRISGLTDSHRPETGNMEFRLFFADRETEGIIRNTGAVMLRNADNHSQTASGLSSSLNKASLGGANHVSFWLGGRTPTFTRAISNFARAYHATSNTDEGTTSTGMGTDEAGLGSQSDNPILAATHRYFGWNFTVNNNEDQNAPNAQKGGLSDNGENEILTATATADSVRGGFSVQMARFVINCAQCTSAFNFNAPLGQVMQDSLAHRLRIDANTVEADSYPVAFTLTQPPASSVFNFAGEQAHVRTIHFNKFSYSVSDLVRAYHTDSTSAGTTANTEDGIGTMRNPVIGSMHRYLGWNFTARPTAGAGLTDDGGNVAISATAAADSVRGGWSVQMGRFVINCAACTSAFSFSAPSGGGLLSQGFVTHRMRIDGNTIQADSYPVALVLSQPDDSLAFNFNNQAEHLRTIYYAALPPPMATGISHVAIDGADPGTELMTATQGVGMGSVGNPYGNRAHGYRFIITFERQPADPDIDFSAQTINNVRRFNSENFEIDVRCGTSCTGFNNINATARRNGNNIEIDITGWRAAGAGGALQVSGIGGVQIKDTAANNTSPYDIADVLNNRQRTFFFSRTTSGADDSVGPAINTPNDVPSAFGDVLLPTITTARRSSAERNKDGNIAWLVTFSEPINGIDIDGVSSQFDLVGIDGTISVTAQDNNSLPHDAFVFTATLDSQARPMTDTTVGLTITSNSGIVDTNSLAFTQTGNFDSLGLADYQTFIVNFENTAPTVSSVVRKDGVPQLIPFSNAPMAIFTVTFSEPVQNVEDDDFRLTYANLGSSSAALDSVAPTIVKVSDSQYDLTFALAATGQDTGREIRLVANTGSNPITDTNGNANPFAFRQSTALTTGTNEFYTYSTDNKGPTVGTGGGIISHAVDVYPDCSTGIARNRANDNTASALLRFVRPNQCVTFIVLFREVVQGMQANENGVDAPDFDPDMGTTNNQFELRVKGQPEDSAINTALNAITTWRAQRINQVQGQYYLTAQFAQDVSTQLPALGNELLEFNLAYIGNEAGNTPITDSSLHRNPFTGDLGPAIDVTIDPLPRTFNRLAAEGDEDTRIVTFTATFNIPVSGVEDDNFDVTDSSNNGADPTITDVSPMGNAPATQWQITLAALEDNPPLNVELTLDNVTGITARGADSAGISLPSPAPSETFSFSDSTAPQNPLRSDIEATAFKFAPDETGADANGFVAATIDTGATPNCESCRVYSSKVNKVVWRFPFVSAPTSAGGAFTVTDNGLSGNDHQWRNDIYHVTFFSGVHTNTFNVDVTATVEGEDHVITMSGINAFDLDNTDGTTRRAPNVRIELNDLTRDNELTAGNGNAIDREDIFDNANGVARLTAKDGRPDNNVIVHFAERPANPTSSHTISNFARAHRTTALPTTTSFVTTTDGLGSENNPFIGTDSTSIGWNFRATPAIVGGINNDGSNTAAIPATTATMATGGGYEVAMDRFVVTCASCTQAFSITATPTNLGENISNDILIDSTTIMADTYPAALTLSQPDDSLIFNFQAQAEHLRTIYYRTAAPPPVVTSITGTPDNANARINWIVTFSERVTGTVKPQFSVIDSNGNEVGDIDSVHSDSGTGTTVEVLSLHSFADNGALRLVFDADGNTQGRVVQTRTTPARSVMQDFTTQMENAVTLAIPEPSLTGITHVATDNVGMVLTNAASGTLMEPYNNNALIVRFDIDYDTVVGVPSNFSRSGNVWTSDEYVVTFRCLATCTHDEGNIIFQSLRPRSDNSVHRIIMTLNGNFGINALTGAGTFILQERTGTGASPVDAGAIAMQPEASRTFYINRAATGTGGDPIFTHQISSLSRTHRLGTGTRTHVTTTDGLGTQNNPFLGDDASEIGWIMNVTPTADGGIANNGGTGAGGNIPTTMATMATGGGYEIAMNRFVIACASCTQAFSMMANVSTDPTATPAVAINNIIIDASTIMADTYPVAITLSQPDDSLIFNFQAQPEHLRTIYYTAPVPLGVTSITGTANNNAGTISWRVTFFAAVDGILAGHFDISDGTIGTVPAASSGMENTITFTSTHDADSDGDITLTFDSDGATPAVMYVMGDSPLTEDLTSPEVAITVAPPTVSDTTPPTATITGTPNNAAGTITWTITFDESVVNVANRHFSVNNGELGDVSGSSTTYTIISTHTHLTDGTITLTFDSDGGSGDAVQDQATTPNTAVDNTGTATIEVAPPTVPDTTAPTATITGTPNNAAGTITWTITFDEPVVNVADRHFSISGNGDLGMVSGSGTTYTITSTHTHLTDGTITLTFDSDGGSGDAVQDQATTPNTAEDNTGMATITVAPPEAPRATIRGVVSDTTITWTITFSETVINLAAAQFTLSVAETDITNLLDTTSIQATAETLTFTSTHNHTNDGRITLTFDPDATNPAVVSSADTTIEAADSTGSTTINIAEPDTTPPTATINGRANNAAGTITWTITFDEPVVNVANRHFSVNNGDLGDVSGSGTTYTITSTHTHLTDGTITLTFDSDGGSGDAVQDQATTPNTAEDNTGMATIEVAPPGAPRSTITGRASGNTIMWTIRFDQLVTNVSQNKFSITNDVPLTAFTTTDENEITTATITSTHNHLNDGRITLTFTADVGTPATRADDTTIQAANGMGQATINIAAPALLSVRTSRPNPASQHIVLWTITFNTPVNSFTPTVANGTITTSSTANTAITTPLAAVAGSGNRIWNLTTGTTPANQDTMGEIVLTIGNVITQTGNHMVTSIADEYRAFVGGLSNEQIITVATQNIGTFMASNSQKILAAMPNLKSRINRVGSKGRTRRNFTADNDSMTMGVENNNGSLSYSATENTKNIDFNSIYSLSGGDVNLTDVELWIEGSYIKGEAAGSLTSESLFMQLGADYLYNENLLLGIMLQIDDTLFKNAGTNVNTQTDFTSEIDVTGIMFAPYFVVNSPTRNLDISGQIAYGTGEGKFKYNTAGTNLNGEFNLARFLLTTTLSRDINYNEYILTPNLSYSHFIDEQKAYMVTDGNRQIAVSASKVELQRLEFGIDASKVFHYEQSVITPNLGFGVFFDLSDIMGRQQKSVNGKIDGGVIFQASEKVDINLNAHYDIVDGNQATQTYGITGGINIKF